MKPGVATRVLFTSAATTRWFTNGHVSSGSENTNSGLIDRIAGGAGTTKPQSVGKSNASVSHHPFPHDVDAYSVAFRDADADFASSYGYAQGLGVTYPLLS